MGKRAGLLLRMLAAASCSCASAGTVEVLHDNWGVPHIYASDTSAMAYGYGWATAEDHGELCLSLYAGARCRAAQYYGGPLDGLAKSLTDRFMLSFGARKQGEVFYEKASDFARSLFDAYAAGFTEYAQTHRERFSAGGLAVLDDGNITGLDIASHSAFDLQLFASTSVFGRLLSTIDSLGAYTAEQAELAARIDPTWAIRKHLRGRDARGEFDFMKHDNGTWRHAGDPHAMGRLGSNAMAAEREGGGGVLHINPHLVWNIQDLPFQEFDGSAMTFYETHIEIAGGGVEYYGASLVGMPVLAMGFGKKGGWAHTVNSQTSYSLYRLTVRAVGLPPDLGEWQYLMDGEWIPFETESFVVQNRDGDDVTHNVLSSNYGPVLLLDILSNTAVVYRYAGWVFGVEQGRPLETVEQLWRQMEADNVDEFKAAVSMQQMPMFTYVYADHNSDLFYQSNSWTPDYSGMTTPSGAYDWSVANGPPVPTETSALRWDTIVPWLSQPQLTSPTAGGISHANEPPWYATLPMHAPEPSDYLSEYPWIAPGPASMPDNGASFGWRPRTCLRLTLEAVDKSRAAAAAAAGGNSSMAAAAGVRYEEFVDASMSVEMESARALLSSLLAIATTAPSCTADDFCLRAANVLTSWDGRCAAESVGALLYERFRVVFLATSPDFLSPFSLADPLLTPSGIPASEAEVAVASLARVAREMEEEDGLALDTAWGAYKKLPSDNAGVQWGLSGSVGDSVRTSGGEPLRPPAGETTATGVAGGTFKSVNEFLPGGEAWGRAAVQTAYGSQTMRGAIHNSDQWEQYSTRRYRTALLNRADVEANTERRVALEYTWPGRPGH
jgi:acyl-homoserine-lactone acylase